jgi:RNA polymerase sigma-70 factor (ECF subfamily)
MNNSPNYNFLQNLYEQEKESMFWYAVSKLRDNYLADEAVQETFVVAWTKVEALMVMENPIGWLFGTLKIIMKRIKSEEYMIHKLLVSIDEPLNHPLSSGDEIDTVLLFDGIVSNEDFSILDKIYIHGYTYKEVADEMGLPLSTVGMRVKRAKERFRKNYEE